MIGIYKIENLINGKVYIGGSSRIKGRISSHKSFLRRKKHCSKSLQESWNKYGEQNFKFEIIEECSSIEEVNEKEKYWILYYKSYDDRFGFNKSLSYIGNVGIEHNVPFSEERKQKMSKTFFKEGQISFNKDKKLSEEHKRKIKNSEIGKKLNWNIVREIREKFSKGDRTKRSLEREYGLSESCIQRILNYKTWRGI